MASDKRSVKIVGYSIIGFFVLFALVLAAEAYFRFQPEYGRTGFTFDQKLVWRLNPGLAAQKPYAMGKIPGKEPFTLKFNASGFRGENFKKNKAPGVTRIMVLGDSYTAGLDYPVEEIFTGILETKLNASERKFEVLNIGVPAWGTDQHYIYWMNEGIKFNPDYLIILLAPNDMREMYNKGLCKLTDNGEIVVNSANIPTKEKLGWFLSSRSSFFQFLQEKVLKSDYGNFFKLFHYHPVNYGQEDADDWDAPIYLKEPFTEIEETYKLFDILLKGIKVSCEANDTKLLLGKIPIRGEIDGTYDTEKYAPNKITNTIAVIAEDNEVPFLNLNQMLTSSVEDPSSIFMSWEYHLNGAGHHFVAANLVDFFNKNR